MHVGDRLAAALFTGAVVCCHPAPTPGADAGSAEKPAEFKGIAIAPSPQPSAAPIAPPPPSAAPYAMSAVASEDDPGRDAKVALKLQLEKKVESGRASDMELNLLISTCKDLEDRPCVKRARELKQQRELTRP
jgi:hypothetical protein